MACGQPYQNPAGLKFVTRVEYNAGDGLYTSALASAAPILNIPNGAGPGTLFVGTHDTYAVWTIRDVKNRVTETQRAYTGAACWESLWVEDGCTVNVQLLDRDSNFHFDNDGVVNTDPLTPRIFAQWFPAGSHVPSFDRLSLVSGPGGTVNPYPLRTFTSPNSTITVTPPGLCRFISIAASDDLQVTFQNITAATNPAYERVIGTTIMSRCVPAWCSVVLQLAPNVGNADYTVCWNRFPMVGGT